MVRFGKITCLNKSPHRRNITGNYLSRHTFYRKRLNSFGSKSTPPELSVNPYSNLVVFYSDSTNNFAFYTDYLKILEILLKIFNMIFSLNFDITYNRKFSRFWIVLPLKHLIRIFYCHWS